MWTEAKYGYPYGFALDFLFLNGYLQSLDFAFSFAN